MRAMGEVAAQLIPMLQGSAHAGDWHLPFIYPLGRPDTQLDGTLEALRVVAM